MLIDIKFSRFKNLGLTEQLFDWLGSILMSVCIVAVLFSFFFTIVGVQGESMLDTLQDGDKLIVSDFMYKPKAGDIVIISRNYNNLSSDDEKNNSKDSIVKRIIATEGQEIDIRDGGVYVDGERLKEDYLNENNQSTEPFEFRGPVTIEKGHIFVMGDNRMNSKDSRSNETGIIDEKYILGKVMLRVIPITELKMF